MSSLPAGKLTFLLTDIEGSTGLLQLLEDRYVDVVGAHRRLLREAFQAWGGKEIDTAGDGFFIIFAEEAAAVKAAVAAQRAIAAYPWPEGAPVRVRIGVHTGQAVPAFGGYIGLDVHRAARIMAAGYGGEILLSQATQSSLEGALPEDITLRDLGEHRLKDLSRTERIFQVVTPDLPSDFPPLRTLDVASNNLPIQLTSFVGREREMTEVRRLLSTARLLTLQGTGGVGKTRLAIQVAANLIEDFRDGVWLVDLAPLGDPALVVQAVASTLGVREMSGRTLVDALLDAVRPKKLLLLLDNCEHLALACAHLADSLLRSCPSLQIVATSREPLAVPGELTYRVPTLSFPDPRQSPSLERLVEFEAIRLFADRAAFATYDFSLTRDNAQVVAVICRHLEGIPLAIELAAARVRGMSVQQIAARLDDRFRLLTGGGRTVLPKHQTLRAAMDWSYDLLLDNERVLFQRLSVFHGGFMLEAAEKVCTGGGIGAFDVDDLLAHLVDKSLVLAEPQNADVRYRLLETIRQYGEGKLLESGETASIRERHLHWHMELAEMAEAGLIGPDQRIWLDRLEEENDNLRAALSWAAANRARSEPGVRLAGALQQFWRLRGYLQEGRKWLEPMVSMNGRVSAAALAKAAYGAGVLAFDQGDYGRAEELSNESLKIYRTLGHTLGIALSLNMLGAIARDKGNYPQADARLRESYALCREFDHRWVLAQTLGIMGVMARRQDDLESATTIFDEAATLWRQLGDRWGLASAVGHLGVVARLRGDYRRAQELHSESHALRMDLGDKRSIAGDLYSLGVVAAYLGKYQRAEALYEESLALSRNLGDRLNTAATLCSFGLMAHVQGHDDRATTLLLEALSIARALGHKLNCAAALCNLGYVNARKGDHEPAATALRESLSLYRELGNKSGIAYCLTGWAGVALAKRRVESAARLLGAAEVLRHALAEIPSPLDRAVQDGIAATVRALLGAKVFEAARAEGQRMTVDQAIDHALEDEL